MISVKEALQKYTLFTCFHHTGKIFLPFMYELYNDKYLLIFVCLFVLKNIFDFKFDNQNVELQLDKGHISSFLVKNQRHAEIKKFLTGSMTECV